MEFERNSLVGRLFGTQGERDEEVSRIETIPGKNRVLIIAPHGFNGDESRNLEADDENTGVLARNLAKKFGFFAVINEKYRKSDSVHDVDPSRFIIDCNRIDQVETHLKKEYLDKILEYKNRIIREKYGTPLIIHLHGIGVDNLEKYIIEDANAEFRTAILVGYGQDLDEERLTADKALVDQLIEHLKNNHPSIKAVKTNPGHPLYRGWNKDNLNQLFRHEGYEDGNVQSIQLEIKQEFRQGEKIEEITEALGNALSRLITPQSLVQIELQPDISLVDHAYNTLAMIFSKHHQTAMMEAGSYIIEEFYGGDIERARENKPIKEYSLLQLIKKLQAKDNGAPSKSWVYNAVKLVVESFDFKDFQTYGNLNLSHKILLLPIKDRGLKEELIQEIAEKELTVKESKERIAHLKGNNGGSKGLKKLPQLIQKPQFLFSDDYSSFLDVKSLSAYRITTLENMQKQIQQKMEAIEEEKERLSSYLNGYEELARRINAVKDEMAM